MRLRFAPALLALSLLLATLSPAARAQAVREPITVNFVDADIAAVARTLASLLGRDIVVDPRVKGTITVVTDRASPPAVAFERFLAALRLAGYTVVDSTGLLKVVPEADAKLAGAPVAVDAPAASNRVLTQIFQLQFESANNLVSVLRPLASANSAISVNPGTNALVVTDYADNLRRLGRIIATLDVANATEVEVIRVHHALAADIAPIVQRMLDASQAQTPAGAAAAAPAAQAGGEAGFRTVVVAESRTNVLLVRAANAARLNLLRAMVAKLDEAAADQPAGNIHVVYLRNVEATRLATVLRAAMVAPGASGGGNSGGATSAPAAASGLPSGGMASASGSGAASSSSGASVQPAAQPSTGGQIQADPASNALIITAPEPQYRQIRAVVDQLDARRAQLYVESLVVEIDASKALDVGLQWKQIFNISTDTKSLTLGTVATALETMAGTNILSTANLVTLDNEEAKIVVGQNVPFVTGSYTSSSSSSNPFQTIERKDVGLTLRVRPQIGRDGAIRMTILQESSSVASTSSTLGPTTNKRSIESTIVVNDGRIIVLGGLIENTYESQVTQIPVLAELPALGALFRGLTRTRKKTNLVVFLRPHVLPDEAAADALTLERYDYIRARQLELPREVQRVLPENDAPLLPAAP